jgi:cytochrome c
MKRLAMILSMLAVASLTTAMEEASVKKGKELFTSSHLGTNGNSCDKCHPDEKGLLNAAGYDEASLGILINQCIKTPLEGSVLELNSIEMKSLLKYIKSLI